MTVISSQRYIDWDIVEEKIEEMKNNNCEKLVVPVVRSFAKDFDDNDLYIMVDCHHRYQAALELGIPVEYEVVEDEQSYSKDIENENSDAILESHYNDSDWYYVETGIDVW